MGVGPSDSVLQQAVEVHLGPCWLGGGRGLEGDDDLSGGGGIVVGREGASGDGDLGLSAVFCSEEFWKGNGMLHASGDLNLLVL